MNFFKSLLNEYGTHFIDDSDEQLDSRIEDADKEAYRIWCYYFRHSDIHWEGDSEIERPDFRLKKWVIDGLRQESKWKLKGNSIGYLAIKDLYMSYLLSVGDAWGIFWRYGGIEENRRYAVRNSKDECANNRDSFAEKLFERYEMKSDFGNRLVYSINTGMIQYKDCNEIYRIGNETATEAWGCLFMDFSRDAFVRLYGYCVEESLAMHFYLEADYLMRGKNSCLNICGIAHNAYSIGSAK